MTDPHVVPRTDHEFYLVVAPGLETLAATELAAWVPDLKAAPEKGGLTVHTTLARGLELNRCLKIPTRILVRIADFGCRDFPKLFKKMAGLNWAEWIGDEKAVEFKASTHDSRLFIKKRIEETCRDGRKAYLKKKGVTTAASDQPITVFVRFQDDVCFVSLDTSGERLHKRGQRAMSSEAPLRESIAAALLWFMQTGVDAPAHSIELVDPMMGGGTFFIEAAGLKTRIDSREFAFESWGGTQVPAVVTVSAVLECLSADVFGSFRGYELDAKTVSAANENWKSTGERRPLEIIEADFFEAPAAPPPSPNTKRWLVCNPPYGERIGVKGSLKDFYEALFSATAEKIRPERACFLLPDRARPQELKLPRAWKKVSSLRLSNGGLPVTALLVST